jgi:hypothetical protein
MINQSFIVPLDFDFAGFMGHFYCQAIDDW